MAWVRPARARISVEATLIDPTDFGSLGIEAAQEPQFGTQADAVFATESWQARASEAALFGTMVDAVYVMEAEVLP